MESRLINVDELILFGCKYETSNCLSSPKWIYDTSYWTGSGRNASDLWIVYSNGGLYSSGYHTNVSFSYNTNTDKYSYSRNNEAGNGSSCYIRLFNSKNK